MAIVTMADATSKGVASSAEYNKVTANIRDLDTRVTPLTTNQGDRGSKGTVYDEIQNLRNVALNSTTGNVALGNKLGSGIGTTTDVTTGTATAQLTDLRSRVATVEVATGAGFIGGEVRATGAAQNLVGGGNKLVFGAVAKTPIGITWDGSTTWTIQSDGVYAMYGNARLNLATAEPALHFSGPSYSDAAMLFPGTSTDNGYGDVSNTAIGFLSAGQQICAYVYTGAATTTYTTRQPMFKIWRIA
jgi:hypothetical protein